MAAKPADRALIEAYGRARQLYGEMGVNVDVALTNLAGSHEFYIGYAKRNNILLCLDSGHFHPTGSMAEKISAILLYLGRLLLHFSRGVRWDRDHIVLLDDEVQAIAQENVLVNRD